ncbi:MAG: exo-alpha-sialidase [Acidobacteria bacterium]|nr:exo-alpha-sialidase [Acidobacteriota bacterium]
MLRSRRLPQITGCVRVYATLDGGYTWAPRLFPDRPQTGADPQVAFSPHGVAYFAALSRATDGSGRRGTGLYFYRSEDGGLTWAKPTDLGISYDHPQIAVDHTRRFAGRIYIGVLWGRDYSLGVFRSDDAGGHSQGPSKRSWRGVGQCVAVMVLSGDLAHTRIFRSIRPTRRN